LNFSFSSCAGNSYIS